MANHTNTIKSTLAALAASAALVTLAVPAAAQPAAPPSYAVQGEEQIQGTIRSIDGKYAISVRDRRGFIDNVQLHDGTIINPTGLRLAPGQRVTIYGRADGNTFAANEIDTPYQTVLVPAYGYYPYGYYPYGPRYGFGLRFGFRG
jgi:hypothetical protein